MIDRKHIDLILAIYKNGSLNKASKELNLTQSALSHQLKNLEDSLGLQLFYRKGNNLLFTEAGHELRERAEKISNDLNHLQNKLMELREYKYKRYVHGYSEREAKRLLDQASTVSEYLHHDLTWDQDATLLEIGCGVGAQTEIIARRNPQVKITSIDISAESVNKAKQRIKNSGITNVQFKIQDIRSLKQEDKFDHVFICFVLEHMSNPIEILKHIKKLIKPQGTITIIEGDHGSAMFFPDDPFSRKVIEGQVKLQEIKGGNANIGRQLYPILSKVGFKDITIIPKQVYVDSSHPSLVQGFIKNTFIEMIQGISTELLSEEILNKEEYERGITGLLNTTKEDGVFSYTFFKARARR